MLFLLFVFFSILNIILLEESEYKCKTSDIDREVEIGDEITLCLHSYKQKLKVGYKLKVDEYSIITIKNGFLQFANDSISNGTPTPTPPRVSKYRRMRIEPNSEPNNETKENSTTVIKTDVNTIVTTEGIINETNGTSIITEGIINETNGTSIITEETQSENITTTDIVNDTNSDEILEDDPKDLEKFIAQIGDKITKYPTVIYIYYLIH